MSDDELPPDEGAASQSVLPEGTEAPMPPGARHHIADEEKHPGPVALVVFGASGDLTSRKILPAVANLARRGALSSPFVLVGVARTEMDDDAFRELVLKATPGAGERWEALVRGFRYVTGEYAERETFDRLTTVLGECDEQIGTAGNRVFYLATIPSMFGPVAQALASHGCNKPGPGGEFARLVVEKPFGTDLESALQLDAALHGAFEEHDVYRIDHYMGKETVQNVMALRFANSIFEPIWNRRYVDSIQVTVAEKLGVEHRGAFYEGAGALRDIVQNHVMQVLSLTLMEPPATMDANAIRDEKLKVLRSVVIPGSDEIVDDVVRAQYGAGVIDGTPVSPYRQEDGVNANSTTETFIALKLHVDNWRWADVPIFVRTGKRLAKRATEVAMIFHRPPHLPFAGKLIRDLRSDALDPADPAGRGDLPSFRGQDPRAVLPCEKRRHGFLLRQRLRHRVRRRLRAVAARRNGGRPDTVHPRRRGDPGVEDRGADPTGVQRVRAAACPLCVRYVGPPGGDTPHRRRGSPLARPMNGELRVVEDVAAAFADQVCQELARFADDAAEGRHFRLALSGGPTARASYEALALRQGIDWSRIEVFWGDERCVPPDDPDSNQRLVREALLANVAAVAGIHPMAAVGGAPEPAEATRAETDAPDPAWCRGADAYHELLSATGPLDLIHLGCGPDGHTASLFPDSEALSNPGDRLAMINVDPSGNNAHPRMTVTLPMINSARLALFTVAGESKREVIAKLRAGADLPAAQVAAERVIWLVDRVAAGESS